MKRIIVGMVLAVVLAVGLQAKPKARTFKESCDKVFPVAKDLASHKPYKLEQNMEKDLALTFQTGSFWKAGAQTLFLQLEPGAEGGCTATVNAPYSGPRRNGTVFLDRLDKALAEAKPAPKQGSK
jgi:hypothetical protein